MTDTYTAPPLATAEEAARELGISRATLFRMVHSGSMPFMRTGPRGLRIPMPAARKYCAGEPIDRSLLANPEVRSCAVCNWSGIANDLCENGNGEIGCPTCGSTQIRTGLFEADDSAA